MARRKRGRRRLSFSWMIPAGRRKSDAAAKSRGRGEISSAVLMRPRAIFAGRADPRANPDYGGVTRSPGAPAPCSVGSRRKAAQAPAIARDRRGFVRTCGVIRSRQVPRQFPRRLPRWLPRGSFNLGQPQVRHLLTTKLQCGGLQRGTGKQKQIGEIYELAVFFGE